MQKTKYVRKIFTTPSTFDCEQEQQDSDCSSLPNLEGPFINMDSDDSQMIDGTTDDSNHSQAMDCYEKEPASSSDVTLQGKFEAKAEFSSGNHSPKVIVISYNPLLRYLHFLLFM